MIKYRVQNQFTKVIDETDALRLEHEYEMVYLVQQSNNRIVVDDDFYGEPSCGLIDKGNSMQKLAIPFSRYVLSN